MKNIIKYRLVILFLTFILCSINICGKTRFKKCLSPIQFGVLEAKTDVERYYSILNCHKAAVLQHKGVNYYGIDSLTIEIPVHGFETIPLTEYTDFSGLKLHCIYHGTKNRTLFSLKQDGISISVDAKEIDEGYLSNLNKGFKIIAIIDEKPWVSERIGHGYSHYRQDMIIVKNKKVLNKPIKSYDNEFSKLSALYNNIVSSNRKIIKNLVFIRDECNTAIIKLLTVGMQYNVSISNISVVTPQNSNFYGDGIFSINNCVKVRMENIQIHGTYSRSDKYGYAFDINNVYNLSLKKIYAHGKWGVFGTNNLQKISLNDCDINRFDIHCYGRDVKCKDSVFRNLYNQFSCTYGTIDFSGCTFNNVIPYLNGGSYNAFVPVNIQFRNCIFFLNKGKKNIIQISGLTESINSRNELQYKALPNVLLKKCNVILEDDMEEWCLMDIGSARYPYPFDGINNITLDKVKVLGKPEVFSIINKEISTKQIVKIRVIGWDKTQAPIMPQNENIQLYINKE